MPSEFFIVGDGDDDEMVMMIMRCAVWFGSVGLMFMLFHL